jgi:hypothetical protein
MAHPTQSDMFSPEDRAFLRELQESRDSLESKLIAVNQQIIEVIRGCTAYQVGEGSYIVRMPSGCPAFFRMEPGFKLGAFFLVSLDALDDAVRRLKQRETHDYGSENLFGPSRG